MAPSTLPHTDCFGAKTPIFLTIICHFSNSLVPGIPYFGQYGSQNLPFVPTMTEKVLILCLEALWKDSLMTIRLIIAAKVRACQH